MTAYITSRAYLPLLDPCPYKNAVKALTNKQRYILYTREVISNYLRLDLVQKGLFSLRVDISILPVTNKKATEREELNTSFMFIN